MNKKLLKIRKNLRQIKNSSKSVTEFTIRSGMYLEVMRFKLYGNYYTFENIESNIIQIFLIFGFILAGLNLFTNTIDMHEGVFVLIAFQAILIWKIRQTKKAQDLRFKKELNRTKRAFLRLDNEDIKKLDLLESMWYSDKLDMVNDYDS